MKSTDQLFLEQAKRIVCNNLDNPSFTAEDFAQQMLLSRSQLHRRLKDTTGKSATDYVRCLRLSAAARLLVETNTAVADIAYQVGFNNLSYFARCFRKVYQYNPSEYRRYKK